MARHIWDSLFTERQRSSAGNTSYPGEAADYRRYAKAAREQSTRPPVYRPHPQSFGERFKRALGL